METIKPCFILKRAHISTSGTFPTMLYKHRLNLFWKAENFRVTAVTHQWSWAGRQKQITLFPFWWANNTLSWWKDVFSLGR